MQNILQFRITTQDFARVLLIAAVYYLAARLGLLLAFENSNATPVWAPSGIAFATILIFGARVWPGIWLGAFIANWAAFHGNEALATPLDVVASAFIAAGNTLEGLAGFYLLKRFCKHSNAFETIRDSFYFLFCTLVMCLVSSVVGTATLVAVGVITWQIISTVWFTWWLGDTAGILIVTPCLVTGWLNARSVIQPRSWIELLILFGSIVVIGQSLFGGWFATNTITSLPYLVAPLLLWAAFRFGPRESAFAVVVVSGLAIYGTVNGTGSFVRNELNESLLLLQVFVCVIAVMNIALAAAVAERRASLQAMLANNETLRQQSTELKQVNMSLQRTNRELDEFAYVISHDLKAPLRGVASLASWLEQDYRDVLQEEGREQLRLLLARVKRMDNLINGVLEYAVIGKAEVRLVTCDTEKLVRDVIDSLQPPPGMCVQIEGTLPKVQYDQTHLMQVFQNLIGNAIKHYGCATGNIWVSCREMESAFEFCVRDAGVGIAPEHHERIFKVFQTLTPRDEKESTGIGLSLVKKVIESYGGKIFLVSTSGQGCAFRFTIPKHRNA